MHSVKFRESNQEAGVALGRTSSYSFAFWVLSKFSAYRNSIVHTKALAKRTHEYTQLFNLRLLCQGLKF